MDDTLLQVVKEKVAENKQSTFKVLIDGKHMLIGIEYIGLDYITAIDDDGTYSYIRFDSISQFTDVTGDTVFKQAGEKVKVD